MSLIRFAFVATIGCLLMSASWAVRLPEPYVVDIPVASQSQAERLQAESAALLVLLERLSGQQLDGNPAVAAAMKRAEQYLLQYSYVQQKNAQQKMPAAEDAAAPVQSVWNLRLVFLPAAIEPLMVQAGITPWPLDRPQVMLLVAGQPSGLLPAPAAGGSDIAAVLLELGRQRGIPLVLPDPAAQDLTVVAAVQTLDAAGLQAQMQAMKADAMLLGNVAGADGKGWSGQWVLFAGGQEQRFQAKGQDFQSLLDSALQQSAGILSGSYRSSTTTDSGPASLRLQVDGVRSYTAFSRLSQYVEQLDAVQHISSTQISGTTVIMDLEVKGQDSFRNLTNLSRSLQWQEEILPPPGSDPATRPVWRYQWAD